MENIEPSTPPSQLTLSAELRKAINERNMLTTRTRTKVINALDNIHDSTEKQKQSSLRRKAIQEILTSEESYLQQLEKIQTYFMNPINNLNFLSYIDYMTLFGNIDTIYSINNELLNELKSNPENCAKAFLRLAPFLKLYSVYAYDYKRSLTILQDVQTNPEFEKFLAQQESCPEVQNKLSALLIAPIQRVPRYCLLLKQVMAYTPPSDPSYKMLRDSLKEVERTASHINNLVEEQEHSQRMLELQRSLHGRQPGIVKPGRKLIKEGALMKVSRKGTRIYPRYFVLMNDILMYCKLLKDKPTSPNSLQCSCILPLNKCIVMEVPSMQGMFEIVCQSERVVVFSDDENESQVWVKVLIETIETYLECRKTLRKDSSSRRPVRKHHIIEYEQLGLSPGQRRQKKVVAKEYPDIYRANDSDDSSSEEVSCFPRKRKKRSRSTDIEETATPSKIPRVLTPELKDSLYPLRKNADLPKKPKRVTFDTIVELNESEPNFTGVINNSDGDERKVSFSKLRNMLCEFGNSIRNMLRFDFR